MVENINLTFDSKDLQEFKAQTGMNFVDCVKILMNSVKYGGKLELDPFWSDEIHDLEPTVCKLLTTLAEKYPSGLLERYKIDELPADSHELLNLIGRKRGCLVKGGEIDTEKVLRLVLTEFRAGKLGRVTLDEP